LGVLDHAFLEAEGFAAGRVVLGGCGLAEQPAQVTEVFLVGVRFFALVPVPLPFELHECHCRMIQPAQRRTVNDSKGLARRAQGEFKNRRNSRSRRGNEAELFFSPKSASFRRRLPFLNSPWGAPSDRGARLVRFEPFVAE